MCGRVSRPVRVFSPMIARAGRLWRAVPTCSIGVLHFRLVASPGRAVKSVAFFGLEVPQEFVVLVDEDDLGGHRFRG